MSHPGLDSRMSAFAAAIADRYFVQRELGAGGMATVYLAEDLRHQRKVAIKVLHPELSAIIGQERFLAEIRLTASLQHPHILPLFDSGAADGLLFYVMPFMEGETLRARLKRERQLPVHDAIRIASEVAAALSYAHRHGVVHRDIKPENILLHDNNALVADFGIALAVESAGGQRMTQTGISLGTPQYMAPEQAMGERDIDARADVYALAVVTFEMLAGEPPFTGPNAQAIVARVLTEAPRSLATLRPTTPPGVVAAVATGLAKLAPDRFTTANDFAAALQRPADGVTAGHAPSSWNASEPRAQMHRALPWLLVLLASAAAAWGWLRPPVSQPTSRFTILLEGLGSISHSAGLDAPTLRADGRAFLYSGIRGQLYYRDLDEPRAVPLQRSENAWGHFISPDGKTIGFTRGFPGDLLTMPLSGGDPTVLLRDSAHGYGGSWSEDGWIYFIGRTPGALMRIRAAGGEAELLRAPDSLQNELLFMWPQRIRGRNAVLFSVLRRGGGATMDIVALDLDSRKAAVVTGGSRAFVAPTGELVWVRSDGTVWAAPFDHRQLALSGRPVQIEENVMVTSGTAVFGLSAAGTMLYQETPPPKILVRVTPDGREHDVLETGALQTFALSPDELRLVVVDLRDGTTELWLRDLRTRARSRLAVGGLNSYRPRWASTGESVLFSSDRSGQPACYDVRADGSGTVSLAVPARAAVDECQYTPDGNWIVYRRGSGAARDVFAIAKGDTMLPGRAIAATDAEEYAPAVSPDGQWVAYISEESGRPEVYVRSYSNPGTMRSSVSTDGGSEPVWGPDSRTLYYRSASERLVRVSIASGAPFRITGEQELFSTATYSTELRHAQFAVLRDGSFLFVRTTSAMPVRHVIVLNWFEEMQRKLER